MKRTRVSQDAMDKHAADVALAARFDELFAQARLAEQALREAQAARSDAVELHRLGKELDAALTAVMRGAFAAERAEIGPQGYEDRIYRRKALATPKVRAWSMEAQWLLTLRESHRLTGIVRVPHGGLGPPDGLPPEASALSAGDSGGTSAPAKPAGNLNPARA